MKRLACLKAAINKNHARLVKRQLKSKRSQLVPHPELSREFTIEEELEETSRLA